MVLHSITSSGAERFEVDALRGDSELRNILKNMGNKTMELKNRVSTYFAIQCTINTEIRLIIYIVHCSFCKKLNRLYLIS